MANATYSVDDQIIPNNVKRNDDIVATYNPDSRELTMVKDPELAKYKAQAKNAVAKKYPDLEASDIEVVDPTKPLDPAVEGKKGEPEPDVTKLPLGDKDPAYIAWYRNNKTAEEFDAKYGRRKFQG